MLLGEGDMTTHHQHFDVHASRANLILVSVIVCPSLAILVVLLRVYTRFILLRAPAIDDAFILLALVSSLMIPKLTHTDMLKGFFYCDVLNARARCG